MKGVIVIFPTEPFIDCNSYWQDVIFRHRFNWMIERFGWNQRWEPKGTLHPNWPEQRQMIYELL